MTTSALHFVAVRQEDAPNTNGMHMLLEAIACIDESIPNDRIIGVLPHDLNIGGKSYYTYTSVHGYELCAQCGKKVALTKDRVIRKHRCFKKT